MKETILIIEDEKDILVLLSSLLESEGYTVITARNGREGLDRFQEHNPDLIITDVRMPVMDGIEVLREVKTKVFPSADTEAEYSGLKELMFLPIFVMVTSTGFWIAFLAKSHFLIKLLIS